METKRIVEETECVADRLPLDWKGNELNYKVDDAVVVGSYDLELDKESYYWFKNQIKSAEDLNEFKLKKRKTVGRSWGEEVPIDKPLWNQIVDPI